MYLAGEDGYVYRFYQQEKTILSRLAPGPPTRRGVAGERGASEEGLRCKPWECDHSGLADLGGEEPVEQRRCCGTAGSFIRGFQLDTPSISGLLASSVDSFVGIANLRLLRAECQAPPRCVNCRGDHGATSPDCPTRIQQQARAKEAYRTRARLFDTSSVPPFLPVLTTPSTGSGEGFTIVSRKRPRARGPSLERAQSLEPDSI